jgi:hypothetical protein
MRTIDLVQPLQVARRELGLGAAITNPGPSRQTPRL